MWIGSPNEAIAQCVLSDLKLNNLLFYIKLSIRRACKKTPQNRRVLLK
ncbi:hypothetical protein [Vibrio sinaloensis]|nr:hypothetical protein [Vibrio sinaloensis]